MFLVTLLFITSNYFSQDNTLDITKSSNISTILFESRYHIEKLPSLLFTPNLNIRSKQSRYVKIYSYMKMKNIIPQYHWITLANQYRKIHPIYIYPMKIPGIQQKTSEKLFFEEESFSIGAITINNGGIPSITF